MRTFAKLLSQVRIQPGINSNEEDILEQMRQIGQSDIVDAVWYLPSETAREFYSELPITLKLTGTYHDMGGFAADVGQLPRIVTLNDVAIEAGKDGNLSMDVTARTFRYLDEDEVAAQRKAAAAKKGPAKK